MSCRTNYFSSRTHQSPVVLINLALFFVGQTGENPLRESLA